MVVQEIKTLDDIVLAMHNKRFLIDKQGMYYKVVRVGDIPNSGIKIMIERGKHRYAYDFDDKFKSLFKIVISNNIKQENKMENLVNQMIQEHKELVPRIQKLHNWVYGGAHEQVDATEFANECIQLKAMKVYEEALRARLFNAGVNFVDGEYLISIDSIEDEKKDTPDND